MAARVATAIREAEAQERMRAAVIIIAQHLGTPVIDLMPTSKDKNIEQTMRYEAMAEQLEMFVKGVDQPAPAQPRTAKK